MEVKIFCMNCKVEILRADTDTLKTPLIGNMFRVKKDMEWSLFSPHDIGNDLLCPMCEWTFHENGKLMIPVNGDFVFGKPEVVIPGILAHETWDDIPSIPAMTATEIEDNWNKAVKEGGEVIKKILTPSKQNQEIIDAQFVEPDSTLNDIMNKVEGNQSEKEKPETLSDPVIQSIQDQVEIKEKEPEKPEPPTINSGDWTRSGYADENSEVEGKAPPGTNLVEESDEMSGKAPPGTKVADSGKIKIKGSKRSKAFFKKAKV